MPFRLSDAIQSATSFSQLAALHSVIGEHTRHALERDDELWTFMTELTMYHDAVGHRVMTLVREQLEHDGVNDPKAPCCWLVLGSRGREEQGIWTDQDTALIYTVPNESSARMIDTYYAELSERLAQAMVLAGYPECTGFVLARNPRWRGTLPEWRTRMTEYMEVPNWDNVRFLMLAADIRAIDGDPALYNELRHWLAQQLKVRPFIHWQVADHEMNHPVAVDFFHRFQTIVDSPYKGLLDIKNGLYMQMANALRLWSISVGGTAHSSRERLCFIAKCYGWDAQFTFSVEQALQTAIRARIIAQLHAEGSGEEANYLDLQTLSKQQVEQLRSAMLTIRQLQQLGVKQFRKKGGEP